MRAINPIQLTPALLHNLPAAAGIIVNQIQVFSAGKTAKDLRLLWNFLGARNCIFRENIPTDVTAGIIENQQLERVEVILLLGNNDLTCPRQAAELYRQISKFNPDLKIVTSGKGGHLTVPAEAFSPSEAERFSAELIKSGIPEKAIIIEPQSTNSQQNIVFSQQKLLDKKITAKRIIIIQSPAAQLRGNLVFEKNWKPDWEYYISYPPAAPDAEKLSRPELEFYLAYALREITTTINYSENPKYDYQTRRNIPETIIKIIIEYFNQFSNSNLKLTREGFFEIANLEASMRCFREFYEKIEKGWMETSKINIGSVNLSPPTCKLLIGGILNPDFFYDIKTVRIKRTEPIDGSYLSTASLKKNLKLPENISLPEELKAEDHSWKYNAYSAVCDEIQKAIIKVLLNQIIQSKPGICLKKLSDILCNPRNSYSIYQHTDTRLSADNKLVANFAAKLKSNDSGIALPQFLIIEAVTSEYELPLYTHLRCEILKVLGFPLPQSNA